MASPQKATQPPLLGVEDLVLRLHAIHAICLDGPYTLKSGLISPFYIDLRLIVSFPEVLDAVSAHLCHLVRDASFDVLCGVPYTALPMATLMSLRLSKPMVMRRKEGSKSYGLKKSVEGVFQPGDTCLVVEDLVTSGLSVFETIEPLQAAGMGVTDVVVLINREQGGKENIEARGVKLHALLTVTQVMEILHRRGKIGADTVEKVKTFVQNSRAEIKQPIASLTMVPKSPEPQLPARLPYSSRVSHATNASARALLQIMSRKRSNLCLSADVTRAAELLSLAERCGPHIAALKTHVDILEDFTPDVVTQLQRLSKQHDFLLFEDRKFADIGSTVSHQYAGGLFRVASWAHITNCHVIPGPGIIAGLAQAAASASAGVAAALSSPVSSADAAASSEIISGASGHDSARGLLLIAEMSSAGALATGAYTDANVSLAEDPANEAFVMGFICQRKLSNKLGLIHMTPGVQLPKEDEDATAAAAPAAPAGAVAPVRTGGDALGQQYTSPAWVIGSAGSDVLIVGRAILKAADPVAEAKRYKEAGWKAYEDSLQQA